MQEPLQGVVAAGHPDTAEAGVEILREGGTAADAAVAACFAAAVAEASLTGLGAGGFALVRTPGGRANLFDFFVAAPGKGRSESDLQARSHLIKYYVPFRATSQLFNVGPSSCAVPGFVPGLARLHERHGRLPLARVLEPAVRLAREGARLVAQQDYLHDILEGILTESDDMRAIFAPEGRLLRAGERQRMPRLAGTLEAVAEEGARVFRDGDVAVRMADAIDEMGGLITPRDLAEYDVVERTPVGLTYRGLEVLSNPLPSSGGTLIAFTLARLARRRLSDADEPERSLAIADALAATADARREGFDRNLHRPGFEAGFLSEANLARHHGPGEPAGPDHPQRGNTTHISVVDQAGMAVSVTSSCGSGSGVVIPGTDVIMNNMMGEEDLNPGGAFSLEPGARLTSMMAPTIAYGPAPEDDRARGTGRGTTREGHILMAVGSAGSERLRSAIVQTLVNVLERGLTAQEAVEAPRLHVDGTTVHLEPGFSTAATARLEAAGYEPHVWPELDLFFGGAQIALCLSGGTAPDSAPPRRYDGGGDPRRGGVARMV